MEWRIRSALRQVLIVKRSDATRDELAAAASPAIACRWLEPGTRMARGLEAEPRRIITDLFLEVDGHAIRPTRVDRGHRRDLVCDALRRGLLIAVETHIPSAAGVAPPVPAEEGEAAPPPPVEETERDWIEIELVDIDDQPIPGERYQVTLPDGQVRAGTLDSNGFAREADVEPGSCTITFPDIDGREWWRP